MRKRLLIGFLGMCLCISLVGCGKDLTSDYSNNIKSNDVTTLETASSDFTDEEINSISALSPEEQDAYFKAKAESKVSELYNNSINTSETKSIISVESEESYKAKCQKYIYNDFSSNPKGMKGKYIVMECEVVGFSHDQDTNEQYIECQYKSTTDMGIVSYVSKPFYVKNYSDKGIDIKQYDLLTVYGTIEKITQSTTWKAGTSFQAIIDAKYIDYNGVFGN